MSILQHELLQGQQLSSWVCCSRAQYVGTVTFLWARIHLWEDNVRRGLEACR